MLMITRNGLGIRWGKGFGEFSFYLFPFLVAYSNGSRAWSLDFDRGFQRHLNDDIGG